MWPLCGQDTWRSKSEHVAALRPGHAGDLSRNMWPLCGQDTWRSKSELWPLCGQEMWAICVGHVAALRPGHLGDLSGKHVAALRPGHLGDLSRKHVAALRPGNIILRRVRDAISSNAAQYKTTPPAQARSTATRSQKQSVPKTLLPVCTIHSATGFRAWS